MTFTEFITSAPGILSGIGLVGIVAIALSILKVGKENMRKWYTVLGIVLAIGLFWGGYQTKELAGIIPLTVTPEGAVEPTEPGVPTVVSVGACTAEQKKAGFLTVNGECSCLTASKTTVYLYHENQFSAGTAVTGNGAHRVFITDPVTGKRTDKGLVLNKDSFETSPGRIVDTYFDENSSQTSTGAYTTHVRQTIPCLESHDITGEVCQYDTSPTFVIWNDDGSLNSAGAQAMGVDTVYTLPFRIKASNNVCAGNVNDPGDGNTLCFEYNQTAYKTIKVTNLEWENIDGTTGTLAKAKSATKPQGLSVASSNESTCWRVMPVADGKELEGDIEVTTDGTSNPLAALDEIGVYLYDVDIDLDADTLEAIIDVEDEDQNDLGYTTEDYIHDTLIDVS